MEKQPPSRRLTEQLLAERGTDLESYVRGLRSQGLSWRTIGDRLKDDHGAELHWTALYQWFRDESSAA